MFTEMFTEMQQLSQLYYTLSMSHLPVSRHTHMTSITIGSCVPHDRFAAELMCMVTAISCAAALNSRTAEIITQFQPGCEISVGCYVHGHIATHPHGHVATCPLLCVSSHRFSAGCHRKHLGDAKLDVCASPTCFQWQLAGLLWPIRVFKHTNGHTGRHTRGYTSRHFNWRTYQWTQQQTHTHLLPCPQNLGMAVINHST